MAGTRPTRGALEARSIRLVFGGVRALEDVNFTVYEAEIVGLIGPNGAGKTSLVNVVSGFLSPNSGQVICSGLDITRWSLARRARHGIVRTFQAARLFPQLSVLENVEAAALGTGIGRAEAGRRARSLLGRMELEPRALYKANSLPGGEQRILGIARALAMLPRFLLLDEPAAGLNESESARLVDAIRDIRRDFGCGVVVIEHDMRVIMPLCERIQVLNYGKTISIGSAAEVQGSPAVIEAYLGKSARHAAKH